MEFEFNTDEKSQEFCESIAREMVILFNINIFEAIGRINRDWRDQSILGDDIVYHETEGYWANNIYFGKSSNWWLSPPGLLPRPFP